MKKLTNKFKNVKKIHVYCCAAILGCSVFKPAIAAPSSIDSPVSGPEWRKHQHTSDAINGTYLGVGNANDKFGWDFNYGNPWDDDGFPVYAVESGTIHTGHNWGGKSFGQLLINHTTDGVQWSSGYLHMKNIVKVSGTVQKGEKIGEISRVGYLLNPAITAPHLHFAVYNSHGRYNLQSVNARINQRTYGGTTESTEISTNNHLNENVRQGDWKYYKISSSDANKKLKVHVSNMSADIDLYVRKGSNPTLMDYDCAPYKGGTDSETCDIEGDADEWFIGVHGFRSASYTIELEHVVEQNSSNNGNATLNRCINRLERYTGAKQGSPYMCYTDYICQNTSGGADGDIRRLAIRNSSNPQELFYEWGGWGQVNISICE